MDADLILDNLVALPAMTGGASPRMIAIRGNRIVYAGSRDALADLAALRTRVVDCGGGLAVPGFNDAHCHPIAHAATLRHVDCSPASVTDIASLQAALRRSTAHPWVRAAGCDAAALAEGRLPTRQELDEAVPDRPVVLVAQSGQSCVLNSMALARCGLAEAGIVEGVLVGNDSRLAAALPPMTADEIEAGLRQVSRLYLENGITSLQDTSWSNGHRHWVAARHFKDHGLLAPRISMLIGADSLDEFAGLGLRTGMGDDHLRLGAMKIALDESTGNCHPAQEEIDEIALRGHLAGFQLSFHVPDVTMLRRGLNALALIRKLSPVPCIRPRLEHCPICPPHLLPAIAEAGAMAVLQPNLLAAAAAPGGLSHLDEERLRWIGPIRSMLATGIPVAFGSDAPLTPCPPLPAMAVAVTRRVKGRTCLSASESIPLEVALDCYGRAGAFCSGREQDVGVIAPGMLADLAVLDRDLLALPPDQIAEAQVVMTVLDGEVAWER